MSTLEIAAIKVEVAQSIRRKLGDDGRTPVVLFSVASWALAESLADMLFAAAKSETQAREMLDTAIAIIESRWHVLAKEHKS
jgi:hypothetical protein